MLLASKRPPASDTLSNSHIAINDRERCLSQSALNAHQQQTYLPNFSPGPGSSVSKLRFLSLQTRVQRGERPLLHILPLLLPQKMTMTVRGVRMSRRPEFVSQIATRIPGGVAAFGNSGFARKGHHKRHVSRTRKAKQSRTDGLWPSLVC